MNDSSWNTTKDILKGFVCLAIGAAGLIWILTTNYFGFHEPTCAGHKMSPGQECLRNGTPLTYDQMKDNINSGFWNWALVAFFIVFVAIGVYKLLGAFRASNAR